MPPPLLPTSPPPPPPPAPVLPSWASWEALHAQHLLLGTVVFRVAVLDKLSVSRPASSAHAPTTAGAAPKVLASTREPHGDEPQGSSPSTTAASSPVFWKHRRVVLTRDAVLVFRDPVVDHDKPVGLLPLVRGSLVSPSPDHSTAFDVGSPVSSTDNDYVSEEFSDVAVSDSPGQ
ncbi:hypothetical protein HK405_000098, partial [Cladochytrium tenue]